MIDISQIYHQSLSKDTSLLKDGSITFRIKTKKNNIKKILLCYGDNAYPGQHIPFKKHQMELAFSDMFDDYYEVNVKPDIPRIIYYFDLYDHDENHLYYYGHIFTHELPEQRNDYFKIPFVLKNDIHDSPLWFKHAHVYNIFLDSFTFSNAHANQVKVYDDLTMKNKLGGNFEEVKTYISNIKDMGFDTIYFNPIFMAGEYHKYDTIDYYKIDPHFGTNQTFHDFVEECHRLGMKVIIDGVFNHSGWYFFAFDDVIKYQEKSRYKDWFYHLDFPVRRVELGEKPPYTCFGYERLMPKLNTSHPEVIDYFMGVARFWTQNYKIDGWRLDVADEVDIQFWRTFRKTVKAINPDVVIIGEVWQDAHRFLDGSMFDSAMNYELLKHAKAFFAHRNIDASTFNQRIIRLLTRYEKNDVYSQMNLLDSHDVPRFLSLCNEQIDQYRLALVFLMTFVGVPMIFYGDEEGLTGLTEENYRQAMRINEDQTIKLLIQQLIAFRKKYPVLIDGQYKNIIEDDMLYGYMRYNKDEEIRIYVNNSEKEQTIHMNMDQYQVLSSIHYQQHVIGRFGYVILMKVG